MMATTGSLEDWLKNEAGLQDKKLEWALGQCEEEMIETVADLRGLNEEELKQTFPKAGVCSLIRKILREPCRITELKQIKGEGCKTKLDGVEASPLELASTKQTLAEKPIQRNRVSGVDLRNACFYGRVEEVKQLLDYGSNVNAARGDNGATALIQAAQNGHLDVVELLLENGASVDHTNCNGTSALFLAAQNGIPEIVQLLLEKGATADLANNSSVTPREAAYENGHFDVVRLLDVAHMLFQKGQKAHGKIDCVN
jgi:hypothetical protein